MLHATTRRVLRRWFSHTEEPVDIHVPSQPNLPYPPLYPNPHSIPNSCPHRCNWDVMGFWTVGRGVSLSSNSQRSVSRFSPPLSTFFHWPGQRFPTNSPHGPPHFFFACRGVFSLEQHEEQQQQQPQVGCCLSWRQAIFTAGV